MSQHKLFLDVDSLAEEFFADTCLFGIQASLRSYRFVWQVNEMLGFNFQIDYEKLIESKHRDRDYYFDVFSFKEGPTALYHHIYVNACDGEFLIPELQHFDSLWLMKGDALPELEQRQLLQAAIRSIPDVQVVVEVGTAKIKMKERLVF
jgi:hypothetical protein